LNSFDDAGPVKFDVVALNAGDFSGDDRKRLRDDAMKKKTATEVAAMSCS
jgi:hypothetical protein